MTKQITVPALGESITEATVAQWYKKEGDYVEQDEPIVELETDKVTIEVNAPVSGTIGKIDVAADSTVEVGAVLGSIEPGAAKTGGKASSSQEKQAGGETAVVEKTKTEEKPQAANIASSSAESKPSGENLRVSKNEILEQIKNPTSAPASAPIQAASTGPREEVVKMSRLRQRIAERLKEAQNTAAMLTTFNEIDMSKVMALRGEYKDQFEKKHGVRLGFMSFFAKAAIAALKEIPAINAEIKGDQIIYKNYYDIGVAVGTPQGLVVPIVRDADKGSFAEIEKNIYDLAIKARDGKLSMAELTGGTFTITNGGVYGSLMSTPILNTPQSGILGMHKIEKRPKVVGDKIEVRPMMYVALSYDHRIVDGREAVTFLVKIKELIEDPQRLLLDV